jgi:hypothetical protein
MLRINGFFIFAASVIARAGALIALAPVSGSAQEMVAAGPPPVYGTPNFVHLNRC